MSKVFQPPPLPNLESQSVPMQIVFPNVHRKAEAMGYLCIVRNIVESNDEEDDDDYSVNSVTNISSLDILNSVEKSACFRCKGKKWRPAVFPLNLPTVETLNRTIHH